MDPMGYTSIPMKRATHQNDVFAPSTRQEWRQAFLVLSAAERMSALGIGLYM